MQETAGGARSVIAVSRPRATDSLLAIETDGRPGHHPAQTRSRAATAPSGGRVTTLIGDPSGTSAGFVEAALMRVDQFFGITFTGLDGSLLPAAELVPRRAVLILLDAHRTRPERTAAEVAWVVERLDTGVDLVLVWPRGTSRQAQGIPALAPLRMVEDTTGAFRRLVSPTGRRIAVLFDPGDDILHPLTAQSPLFDVGHGTRDASGRGTDRTVDLGDMHH